MTFIEKIEKKKPYISFKKIGTFRQGLVKTPNGGRVSKNSFTLNVFEHIDGISFNCRSRNSISGAINFSDQFLYKLKLRKNKIGESRFIFYKIKRGAGSNGVTTSNPNRMRGQLAIIYSNTNKKFKHSKIDESDIFKLGIPKAQRVRLLSFIRAFLKKNKIEYKNLSNDPFSLMCQLCYPGSIGFDEQTLQVASFGSFFLKDPVFLSMKTNGKKSRKLVYQVIKKHPKASQSILRIAKYIRIRYSLDHAQKFLEMFNVRDNCTVDRRIAISCSDDYKYSYARLSAKQLKVLDKLNIEQIAESMANFHLDAVIADDTFHMIEQLGGQNGFNLDEIQYTSIRELHDILVNIGRPRESANTFIDYSFDEKNDNMQFCKAIQSEFKSNNLYWIDYAKDTEELRKHAEIMRNCSFYYYDKIKAGNYAIFCISKLDSLKYMFGIAIRDLYSTEGIRKIVMLDQAVGKCNKDIDTDDWNSLSIEIIDAIKKCGFEVHNQSWEWNVKANVR